MGTAASTIGSAFVFIYEMFAKYESMVIAPPYGVLVLVKAV